MYHADVLHLIYGGYMNKKNNFYSTHIRSEAAVPKNVKDLTSYHPVLDLLRARRVSPVVLMHKPAQSARYPDSLTSFAPSVRKSASPLVPFHKTAFTLAEVLITLAIIGIVAALTIPNLVMKYKEKVTVTKVQKAYSVLNSAYKMALVTDGEFSTWGFANDSEKEEDEDGNTFLTGDTTKNSKIFWDKITKNLNVVSKCMPEESGCYRPDDIYNLNGVSRQAELNKYAFITLNNGMTLVGGWVEDSTCQNKDDMCGDFGIDINGIMNPPNSVGQDIFYFAVYPDRVVPRGSSLETLLSFDKSCNRTNAVVGSSQLGYGCAAWVIEKGNLDYLHCDDLSWTGKQKCD